MTTKDTKPLINGAYSLKYQLLEQERLQRFQFEHKNCSKSMRDRAHLLSKQTQQRRRALEVKKQAMAKAEEDRRKEALEERRRQQKEATERFRSVISRQQHVPKHSKSRITFEAIHSRNTKQHVSPTTAIQHSSNTITDNNRTSLASTNHRNNDRVVLGREVEVPPIATFTVMKDPPDLDEVLENIRAGTVVSDPSPSVESIILSPEPSTLLKDLPSNLPKTKQLFETPEPSSDTPSSDTDKASVNSGSSSSSSGEESTLSLHDSIDDEQLVIEQHEQTQSPRLKEVNNIESDNSSGLLSKVIANIDLSAEEKPHPLIDEPRPLNNEITNESRPLMDEPSLTTNEPHPLVNESKETEQENQKKGILKKPSYSDLSRTSSSSSSKRVRFSETVHEQRTLTRDHSAPPMVMIPKMRISLNNKPGGAGSSGLHHNVLSSTVTKLVNNNRNGITIHVPMHQGGGTTPPQGGMANGVYHHHPDGASSSPSNSIWSNMALITNDEYHDRRTKSMPVIGTSSRLQQQPVKLWKRQQHQSSKANPNTNQGESIYSEEKRLMESIELINNRLRALPTSTIMMDQPHPLAIEPQPALMVRSPPSSGQQHQQQYNSTKRGKSPHSSTGTMSNKHRTSHNNNNR